MGFLSKLFGRSENSGDSDNSDVPLEDMLFECEECMRMVPDEEYYEGLCYGASKTLNLPSIAAE